jgi:hypothetical protein
MAGIDWTRVNTINDLVTDANLNPYSYGYDAEKSPWSSSTFVNALNNIPSSDSGDGGSSGGTSQDSYDYGEEGGGEINIGNIVPEWVSKYNQQMTDYASGAMNKYGTDFLDLMKEAIEKVKGASPYEGKTAGYVDELGTAYQNLKNAPQYIEQARTSIPKQYLAGMAPMRDLYQGAMDNMAGRGILNSTVTGDALAKINEAVNRDYASKLQEANTWAAQQNLTQLNQLPEQTTNIISALNNLDRYWLAKELGWGSLAGQGQGALDQIIGLGATGAGNQISASGTDYAPWATLLPLLLGS